MSELTLTASAMFANAARFTDAYHAVIAPLCEKTQLPPAAVDILLFLANNPGHDTAAAVCRMRGLKPAIVSFHVDRLVTEGYLTRQGVPGDRRKTSLSCTGKAAPIIEQGRMLQRAFAEQLTDGLNEEDLAHFRRCIAAFDRNIERIRTEGCRRRETQP
mgnify:CR=1 FL=1